MESSTRVRRSGKEKIIAGVCGGLAEYFAMDPAFVRLAFTLLVFMGGSGLILYIVLMFVMPSAGRETPDPEGAIRDAGEAVQQAAETVRKNIEEQRRSAWWTERRNIGGLMLIGVGALILLGNVMPWHWVRWEILWPLALVGIGVLMITGGRRR